MRFPVLALALLGLSGAVGAQNTTTTCRDAGFGTVTCDSHTQQPAVPANPNAISDFVRSTPDYSRMGASIGQMVRQREQKERFSTAVRMIANGDCEGAERYALQEGDIQLAQIVKSYCAK